MANCSLGLLLGQSHREGPSLIFATKQITEEPNSVDTIIIGKLQICVETPEALSDSCAGSEQARGAGVMSKGRALARTIIVQVHTS